MWTQRLPAWKPFLKSVVIIAAIGAVALTIFVLSGVYNVAASSDHFGITNRVIKLVLNRSIATRSLFVENPPDLADPDLIRLGAGHYGGGCAPCHGSPGDAANPIARAMLPAPPNLEARVDEWDDKELFWIVLHGLKFTGMPAWVAQEREDEVWALVAFIRQLPGMQPAEYRMLARGNLASPEPDAPGSVVSELAALTECSRCHDTPDAPPASALTPRLAGQSQAYLERALAEYAVGLRPSGVMHPVAFELEPAEMQAFADYYAALPGLGVPRPEPLPAPETGLDLGRRIAERGIPEEQIPPCLACHSGRAEAFPQLAGQSAAYLAGQLQLWQEGGRDQTTYGRIMAPIASRLTAEHIAAVTSYFESVAQPARVAGETAR